MKTQVYTIYIYIRIPYTVVLRTGTSRSGMSGFGFRGRSVTGNDAPRQVDPIPKTVHKNCPQKGLQPPLIESSKNTSGFRTIDLLRIWHYTNLGRFCFYNPRWHGAVRTVSLNRKLRSLQPAAAARPRGAMSSQHPMPQHGPRSGVVDRRLSLM